MIQEDLSPIEEGLGDKMIVESIVGLLTAINVGTVGWIVRRQETMKKDFMDLRSDDLQFLGENMSEIKTDIREIFKLLAQDKQ